MSRELDRQIDTRIMGQPANTLIHGLEAAPPYYSQDLVTCRLAEMKIIEMGKGEAYAAELHSAVCWQYRTQEQAWLHLATAPAEARCRAMLSVLEGEE